MTDFYESLDDKYYRSQQAARPTLPLHYDDFHEDLDALRNNPAYRELSQDDRDFVEHAIYEDTLID